MLFQVYLVLKDIQWSYDSSRLYTASADKSVQIWDLEENKRVKKIKGHSSFVNSVHANRRGYLKKYIRN